MICNFKQAKVHDIDLLGALEAAWEVKELQSNLFAK
jgi:hypothetical protein